MNDANLIENLKSGSETAFREVFEQNQKIVMNTCYRFVLNTDTAEDLTQDVFVEVFRSIGKFRGNAKLSTWIYRIAVTKSLDYLKSKKRKKRFAFLKSISDDESLEERLPAGERDDPSAAVENLDRIRALNAALDSLPANQRAAFTLSKYDELSYKEIAEILDTTNSAVESLIHRAKKNLEKKLTKFYKNNF